MSKVKLNIKLASIIMLAVGMVCACGNNSSKDAKDANVEQTNSIAEAHKTIRKVVVGNAVKKEVPQEEVYSSSIEADAVCAIAPQGMARIENLKVEVGDFVRAGQVVAMMEDVALKQLKLKMNNDSLEFSRLKSLYEEGGVSKSDLDAVELGYNVSKSKYENMLENTILRSPVSGVVTQRNYEAGDMYSVSKPIYEIMRITPVKLNVAVSESDYLNVHKGGRAVVNVLALPEQQFEAKINRVHPTIDQTTRTFIVELSIANRNRMLKPGMYAKAKVYFPAKVGVVVPDRAICKLQGSGDKLVYVVKDGVAHSVRVELGKHFGNEYEVISGVSEGDVIVIKGNDNLKNGDKVQIIG